MSGEKKKERTTLRKKKRIEKQNCIANQKRKEKAKTKYTNRMLYVTWRVCHSYSYVVFKHRRKTNTIESPIHITLNKAFECTFQIVTYFACLLLPFFPLSTFTYIFICMLNFHDLLTVIRLFLRQPSIKYSLTNKKRKQNCTIKLTDVNKNLNIE